MSIPVLVTCCLPLVHLLLHSIWGASSPPSLVCSPPACHLSLAPFFFILLAAAMHPAQDEPLREVGAGSPGPLSAEAIPQPLSGRVRTCTWSQAFYSYRLRSAAGDSPSLCICTAPGGFGVSQGVSCSCSSLLLVLPADSAWSKVLGPSPALSILQRSCFTNTPLAVSLHGVCPLTSTAGTGTSSFPLAPRWLCSPLPAPQA